MKIVQKKILLGLTTTPRSNWREKIQEIDQLGLEEIAAFPTFLKLEERKEYYALLEKTQLKNIPHVHLRDDMEDWEIEYFLTRWKTQVFNIHSCWQFFKFWENKLWKERVFVENQSSVRGDFTEIANLCGGICLDFAHWKSRENNFFNGYWNFEKILKKFPIGCCHISAIRREKKFFWTDDHHFRQLSEFDYLKEKIVYLPELVSLELENSFTEQLLVQKYLKEHLFIN